MPANVTVPSDMPLMDTSSVHATPAPVAVSVPDGEVRAVRSLVTLPFVVHMAQLQSDEAATAKSELPVSRMQVYGSDRRCRRWRGRWRKESRNALARGR